MKKFEVLEHTADLKIRVFGRDLPELFINAALAMAEQQRPGSSQQKPTDTKHELVEISSSDINSLLVDWLSELLSRGDINKVIYTDFAIVEFTNIYLRAKISGLPAVERQLEIKAVTYHGLAIKKTNDYWQATIIFDI